MKLMEMYESDECGSLMVEVYHRAAGRKPRLGLPFMVTVMEV